MNGSKICFPPIVGTDPRVLILGSMPGERSLAQVQYYAHPRNAFWHIMGRLLGFDAEAPYAMRVAALKKNRVALWDVLRECERAGSLDSSIVGRSIKTNDFSRLLTRYPGIRLIAFNGSLAEKAYRKNVLPGLNGSLREIRMIRLPSTSPAMASLSREEKMARWSVIAEALSG